GYLSPIRSPHGRAAELPFPVRCRGGRRAVPARAGDPRSPRRRCAFLRQPDRREVRRAVRGERDDTGGRRRRDGRPQLLSCILIGMTALREAVLILVGTLCLAQQSTPPAFEVASLKLTQHGRDANGFSHSSSNYAHGVLTGTNTSLSE